MPFSWVSCTDPQGQEYRSVDGSIEVNTSAPCAQFVYNDDFISQGAPPHVSLLQSQYADPLLDLTLYEGRYEFVYRPKPRVELNYWYAHLQDFTFSIDLMLDCDTLQIEQIAA